MASSKSIFNLTETVFKTFQVFTSVLNVQTGEELMGPISWKVQTDHGSRSFVFTGTVNSVPKSWVMPEDLIMGLNLDSVISKTNNRVQLSFAGNQTFLILGS